MTAGAEAGTALPAATGRAGGGRRPGGGQPIGAVERRARGRARGAGLSMVAPPIVVIAVFIGFPIVTAILYTLGHTGGTNSVIAAIGQDQHVAKGIGTLAAYREVLGDSQTRTDIWVTIVVTLISVAVVILVAWSIALYLRLAGNRLSKVVASLSVVPLFIPVVIASFSIRDFYATDGFLRSVAGQLGWHSAPTLTYTMVAITIGEIWTSIPFGVLLMSSGLAAVPDALIEAARDAGASMPRAVLRILLPMNLIPTVIVTTFTAISVLGSFTVPYLTGPSAPNMLGVSMNNYFQGFNRPQQAEVLAVVVFLVAVVIGSGYVWANVRASRATGSTA